MISLELSLKHLAWSNQKFFTMFLDLPDEVFGLKASEGEWPVGKILTHFAGSGEWYSYCLSELNGLISSQLHLVLSLVNTFQSWLN
jgi:hypothetical protein